VGAVEEWFNFAWLDHAADQLPQYQFVLIGPEKQAKAKLVPRENLHILGPRPFKDLPQYLQHASVGVIPFDTDGHRKLVHTINPLKLYEYMASGLPVVASRWDTLEQLGSPALLAGSAQEFCGAVQAALEQKTELGKAGQEFAARFDWQARVDSLLDLLELS
jgi:glycosyltransferase involved in cell wall biosynthesis